MAGVKLLSLLLLASMAVTCPISAAESSEFFVSPNGTDSNSGLDRVSAFATVQRGVDALSAGDTLTILPGEYLESVSRQGLGSDAINTTIRAAIPGTVVLRGDVPAPPLSKMEELQGPFPVYSAKFDAKTEVRAVNEVDTLLILQAVGSLGDVQLMPGAFYQDPETGTVYLTTTDNQPAAAHAYRFSVIKGNGLEIFGGRDQIGPQRVVVEGLAATGFNATHYRDGGGTGITLDNAKNCIVRNCSAWLNGWGIRVSSKAEGAGGNVIEHCTAWANDSMFANSRIGGLIALNHRADVIRDSLAYLNANCGIYLRGDADPQLTSRLDDNLAWGNRWDYIIKGNPERINVSERNIGPTIETRANPFDSLMLLQADKQFSEFREPGTIVLDEEKDLVMEDEFVDPFNHDYRMQATSRFRGSGPGGSDRGPFPFQANVFFVSPDGSDSANGLAVSEAWRSLERATKSLRPGDTLYLLPGMYRLESDLALRGEEDKPVRILGRGADLVIIQGPVRLANSHHLEFARLQFDDKVQLDDTGPVTFENCWFSGAPVALAALSAENVRITHCGFSGFRQTAIELKECADVHLSGNLFDNQKSVALCTDASGSILYSDYNAFRRPASAWEVDGKQIGISSVPGGAERHSVEIPDGHVVQPGITLLAGRPPFAADGPLGRSFGPQRTGPRLTKLHLASQPTAHFVGATTADIEWGAVLPCRATIAWGTTPELENHEVVESEYFGRYGLTDLQPDTTYYFQIQALEKSQRSVGQHTALRTGTMQVEGGPVEENLLVFTTPKANPTPAVYHVAADGDDSRDGLSRDSAWATIQHAANQAKPGDTILIGEGTYEEEVRVRTSGAPDAPITFRAAPGEQVVLSAGHRELPLAFGLAAKHHLRFDGFYLIGKGFDLYKSSDVEISRCYAGPYSSKYTPPLLHALDCADLTVSNCVSLSAKSGPTLQACTGRIRIENNVFFRNMIRQFSVSAARKQAAQAVIARNIFTDGLEKKFSISMTGISASEWKRFEPLDMVDNCFFPRRDPQKKLLVNGLTYSGLDGVFGDTRSIVADPGFAGAPEPVAVEPGETQPYPPDRMVKRGVISMDNFFATDPDLVKRSIGLQPDAFADFHFNQAQIESETAE